MTKDADGQGPQLSAGLGPDPERTAFEAWLIGPGGWAAVPEKREGGSYINGQAQARWIGWQAAAAAMRERWADLASMQADIYWAAWDEHADPSDQGAAAACEMLADAIRGPNVGGNAPDKAATAAATTHEATRLGGSR